MDESMSPITGLYKLNILECQFLTFCLKYKQYIY